MLDSIDIFTYLWHTFYGRMILYAIAMADYDQEDPVACKKQIKTKDGMESLALYHSSVGR